MSCSKPYFPVRWVLTERNVNIPYPSIGYTNFTHFLKPKRIHFQPKKKRLRDSRLCFTTKTTSPALTSKNLHLSVEVDQIEP